MREIKFRAWDNSTNNWLSMERMAKIACFGQETESSGIILMSPQEEKSLDEYAPKTMVFNLSTGLQDKNGKEIYEGDIVETPGHVGDDLWREKVVWHGTGFVCEAVFNPSQFFALRTNHEYEVIGNIHENPELLK